MSMTEAIIQGIIQGLTEFLPVSSSGHLALYQYFTGNNSESGALFSLVLHLGTLVAVFIAFWGSIRPLVQEFFCMLGDLFKGRFSLRTQRPQRRMIFLLFVSLLPARADLPPQGSYAGGGRRRQYHRRGGLLPRDLRAAASCQQLPPGRIKAGHMSYRAAAAIGIAQGRRAAAGDFAVRLDPFDRTDSRAGPEVCP